MNENVPKGELPMQRKTSESNPSSKFVKFHQQASGVDARCPASRCIPFGAELSSVVRPIIHGLECLQHCMSMPMLLPPPSLHGPALLRFS
jgi:hypothetical protein